MTPDGARPTTTTLAPPPSQQPEQPQRLLLGISSLTLDAPMGHVLAVALDAATGREVARATAPRRSWWRAVESLPSVALSSVAGACAALPTRDPSRELADLERELSSRLPPNTRVMAVQEGVAALAAAAEAAASPSPAPTGVAVALVADEHVCAYGSAAVNADAGPLACPHAQQHQPKEVRVSGWGPRFSDGGSALDLGQRALAAASKASDGRGAPTSLVRDLTRHLGLDNGDGQDDARALADWAYHGGGEDGDDDGASFQRRVCALAPVVDRACAAGDAVAETILRHGVGELFRCVVVAAARLGVGGVAPGTALAPAAAAAPPPPPTSFRVVLAGALLRPGTSYAQLLAEALKDHAPAAVVAHLSPLAAAAAGGGGGVEPAVAAARMLLLPPRPP